MKDKKTLVVILILLFITLPFAIIGMIYKNKGETHPVIDNNDNKDFIYNNTVYFYDNTGYLVSTYPCSDECSLVKTSIDDASYHTNYYKKGTTDLKNELNNDYYVFNEGKKINLYSTITKSVIISFDSIKTYNVKHSDPVLILKVDGKVGVLSITSMMPVIPYTYDYIAIPNKVANGVLDTSSFIAKSGSNWFILNNDGTYYHTPFTEEIIDFSDKYVVTFSSGIRKIYDYNKQEYFAGMGFNDIRIIGDYVVFIKDNLLILYEDLNTTPVGSMQLNNYKDLDIEIVDNLFVVYLDYIEYQSIDLK